MKMNREEKLASAAKNPVFISLYTIFLYRKVKLMHHSFFDVEEFSETVRMVPPVQSVTQLKQTIKKKPFTLAVIFGFAAIGIDLTTKVPSLEDDVTHFCKI